MKEQTEAPRRKGVDGERLIAEYEASGLGRKAFCVARSISVNTLDYWRKRARRRSGGVKSAGFVELAPMVRGNELEVELELGGSVVLRIRRSG